MFPIEFYRGKDVVHIAKSLLGASLFTQIDGELTGGIIVETEAYGGIHDRASHAYGGRRTARTEVMYRPGGVTYVHLCYGIHTMLNIITHEEGIPDGILIRAIVPTHGIEIMQKRRKSERFLADGPGKLCQALGITLALNGYSIYSPQIWVEKPKKQVNPQCIKASPRIGVDYAKEDALRPWRFNLCQLQE